ncbi:hypothetical protein MHI37_02635 [Paenibacillus sp. FSL H8-0548]|uniref:hypothetical protein n=1 Tax=Paenibacillus sp. FSL H8-0548 TaxID=1920422 RepID=UPI0015C3812C|nr:hypothetical protein [Paenibacillus sp. FSL H8-0548]
MGDGMKQAKEARRMPGVKKLHQESKNSSKAKYIFGHLFGAIGILMGTSQKSFGLPLFIILQGGCSRFSNFLFFSQTSLIHNFPHAAYTSIRINEGKDANDEALYRGQYRQSSHNSA